MVNFIMFFIFVLISFSSGHFFNFFEEILTPGDIYWPDYWVANNIETSSNHAGSDIMLTVHCRVSIDLPSSFEATLIIPKIQSNLTYQSEQYIGKGQNTKFYFLYYASEPGVLGPISLIIRDIPGGQIIASKAALGEIAIIDPMPTPENSLGIYFEYTSYKISDPAILRFSFPLPNSDIIGKYDYFILEIDKSFTYTKGEAKSTYYYPDISLDLIYNQGQSLIIYGLKESLSPSSTFYFTISGFLNPSCQKPQYSFLWTLSIKRFGTPTFLKIFTGNGPEQSLIPGTIKSPSWKLFNDYIDKSDYYAGLITFTELSFTLEHEIAWDGKLTINYYGVNINEYSSYPDHFQNLYQGNFIKVKISTPNCFLEIEEINSYSASFRFYSNIPKDAVITIYNFVTFTNTAYILSITTFNCDESRTECFVIDSINNYEFMKATEIILNQNSKSINNDASIYFTKSISDINSVFEVGDSGTYGLVLSFYNHVDFNSDYTVSVMFPMIIDNKSDLKKVAFDNWIYGLQTYSNNKYYSDTFNENERISVDYSKSLITFNISRSYNYGDYVNIYLGSEDEYGNKKNIYLPYFPTTDEDMFELVLKVKKSDSDIVYYLSKPIIFAENMQGEYSLNYFCLVEGIPGFPVKISFIPPFSFYHPDYNVHVSFYIYDNLGTGLGIDSYYDGNIYPHLGDYSVYYTHDSYFTLKMDRLKYDPLASDDENRISFIIPFQSLSANFWIHFDVAIYAVSENQRIKMAFQYYNEYIYVTETYTNENYEIISNDWEYENEIIKSFSEILSDHDESNDEYDYSVAISLGKGFRFTSNYITIGQLEVNFELMSDDNLLYFNTVGYIESVKLADKVNTDFTFKFKKKWFYPDIQNVYLAYVKGQAFTGLACEGKKAYGYEFLIPKFIYTDYTPLESNGYTFLNPTTEISISFLFTKTIYSNSKIEVLLNSDIFDFSNAYGYCVIGSYELYLICYINKCTSYRFMNSDVSDSMISITIKSVNLPIIDKPDIKTNPFVSVRAYFSDSSSNEYTIYTWTHIDDAEDEENETRFLFKKTLIKPPKFGEIWVFPTTKQSKSVHFGISFSSPYDLSYGAKIIISGENFNPDDYPQDNIGCNYKFSSSSINSNNELELEISSYIYANNNIYITKNKAFNLSDTNNESAQFHITIKYNGFIIVKSSEIINGLTFIIDDLPEIRIKKAEVLPEILNKGAKSDNSFLFSLNSYTDPSWIYCFEASIEYDAHPGDIFTIDGFDGLYYMNAKSNLSKEIFCTTDYWFICCNGFNTVIQADTTIDITIYLTNPATDKAFWNFYIINDQFTSIVLPKYNVEVEFIDIPENLADIYYVSFQPNYSQNVFSNVMIEARIEASFEGNSFIYFKFPYPFDLELYNPGFIGCYADYSRGNNNNFAECKVKRNIVIINIYNTITLTKDYWTIFYFQNVVIPPYGLKRDSLYDEEIDYYDLWVGKFSLSFLESNQASETQYKFIGQSFSNINAAFTGFQENEYQPLIINEGNPIIICPGVYSSYISITVKDDFNAYYVIIYPNQINNEIFYFDRSSYRLDLDNPRAYFRVGTPSNTSEGIYYLSWSIEESGLNSKKSYYKAPPLTKIQVFYNDPYNITIQTNLSIKPKTTSLPFYIKFEEVLPFNKLELYLNAEPVEYTSITITPYPILMKPRENLTYFTIYCDNCILGNTYYFTYELSGDNKNAFNIVSDGFFTANFNPANEISCSIYPSFISQVSVSVVISASQDAVFYWALMSKSLYDSDQENSSLEKIKNTSKPLIGNLENIGTTLEDQEYEYINKMILQDQSNYTWEEYSWSLYKYAQTSTYFASINTCKSEEPQIVYIFNHLIAGTEYILVAYVYDYNGNVIESYNDFSTSDLLRHAKVKIYFNTISPVNLQNTIKVMSHVYKSDIRRFFIGKTSVRKLDNFVAEIVFFSSFFSVNSPINVVNFYQNMLKTPLIIAGLPVKEANYTEDFPSEIESPDLQGNVSSDYGIIDVIFEFKSTVNGIFYCGIIRENSRSKMLVFEILLNFYKGFNESDSYKCIEVMKNEQAVFKHTFYAIENKITFILECSFCDDYPIWPTCINLYEYSFLNY
ncbi:hypothetical protein SteCoe_2357 [Stentor coeruleus]|uniref:PKD/REJ-like domain-containing protein n=1 Tax=Stentor coeruleus TaxID=5963 RepID=A0A1R2CZM3_9CILI|nr:hypothetical protein SteCoe_2357 [Stentor coeruleus]